MNGGPLNILLVEDNAAHAELVMDNLRDHRIANDISLAKDGAEALDFLFQRGKYENAPRPNLILLDLRLPKLDGMEVLKIIKEDNTLSDIPVVILTTSDADNDVIKAYKNRANSYLVKPVNFDKFRELMTDLGFYWLLWNQPCPASTVEKD